MQVETRHPLWAIGAPSGPTCNRACNRHRHTHTRTFSRETKHPVPPGAGLLVRRYSCTHSLGVPCRMCVSTANTHAVGLVPSHARPAGGAFLASSASCLDRGSVLGRPSPLASRARPLGGDRSVRARTGRCARSRSRRRARYTGDAWRVRTSTRTDFLFSRFALRSIIQHKSVAPPAQNPYWLVLYDAVHGRSSASWATWVGPAACPPPQPACPTLGTLSVAQGPPWPLCR